jgi:3-hydroxyisobutyrate dehydrogenase-like beta-hydroxyacid dehydrogenase
VIQGLARGGVHVSMSTISVALSERPPPRTRAPASASSRPPSSDGRTGPLRVSCSSSPGGPPEIVDALQPLFAAMGQRTIRIGDAPREASLVKLSGNFLIASVIEAVGEAMALVGKAGIDRQRYFELLTSTLFTGPVFTNYGGLIARQQFQPAGFAAPLGEKDIRLALAAAQTLRVPMPLASLLHDRLLALIARGGEELDWSAIGKLAADDAGL